ncbi:alpha/beta hydrolase family protein [Nitratireductor sp. GCM10026969]|uniref:alpha/beta hydrolase family protein n=1 Tax=Nitratireductor sp. GCM10026969 TaxID=3252645 RepID=UPI00360F5131
MSLRVSPLKVPVAQDLLSGQLVEPQTGLPGVLFVHGWNGSQERDRIRARALSQFGFVSLTFDLRGHGASTNDIHAMTREDHLQDICAAYDTLAQQPQVDRSSIAVVGSSYGAYLATVATARRPVRWLALRVPALYRDEDWDRPKAQLDREDLASYRRFLVSPDTNVALRECSRFTGDVLIVESEHDEIVPHPAIASYLTSFVQACSVTYRIIAGADHALSDEASRRAYDQLLSHWLREMIFGAR